MLDFSGTERALSARVVKKLKQRLDPPKRPQLNITDIRREALKNLGNWLARKTEDRMYKWLTEGDAGKVEGSEVDVPVVSKRPP